MLTELALNPWRLGQVVAERLCAGILRISGYTDIEPQAPLGGPDGKKDVVVRRDGRRYVAAVYFPTTASTFAATKRKYKDDLRGVEANSADGFIFLVNQHLSVGERADLLALGGPYDEIFNVERMRAALDDPRGYGLRLEFLRIPMSPEEQVAFFNTDQQDRIQRLLRNELQDEEIAARLPTVARLDSSLLRLLHAAMFEKLLIPEESSLLIGPRVRGGRVRAMQTYVVDSDGEFLHAGVPPEQIEDAMASLFVRWRHAYAEAVGADREVVLRALAGFHHEFVSIMPFSDGNGRLARIILDQAAFELCRRGVATDLTADRPAYFKALRAADAGDLNPLVERLRAALT
ncbi:Fic family protein [Streptomyces phaeochromogenes]|uniref:Fic family protein n=1 Tax=Streptomyces phaeochromogenes TaxID=1923 RepID=UPI00386632AC|nr:Fic family protein [Streptomyces phaeochromogenes]